MKQHLVLRLTALLPFGAVADLPVHCLRHQIVGDWEFSLSPAKPERPSCGHQRPDSQDRQPPVSLLASLGPTTALRLSVQDPDSVSTSKGDVGTWTMIYDEGWEVSVGGKTFFAFSKFEMVPDGHGGQTNVSHCDETLIGWYRDRTRTRWGCYHGRKAGRGRAQQAAAPEGQEAAARGTAAATRGASAASRGSSLVSKASIFDYAALAAPDAGSDSAAEAQASSDASVDGAEGRTAQDDESDAAAPADDQGALAPPPGRASAPAADGGPEAAPTAAAEPPAQPEAPAAAAQSEAPAQSEAEQAALAALVQSGNEEEDEEDEGAEGAADGSAPPAPERAAAPPAPAGGQRAAQSFLADVYDVPSSYTPWVPKSAGFDKPMQHRWQQAVAEALNFMQLGWTAGVHSMFVGKTPRELNRFAGTRRARIPPQRKSPGPLTGGAGAGLEALSFMALRSRRKRERSQESVDWRRVNGKNWLEPVVSQGDCGSCYAISTVHMLTARNRIRRGDPSEPAFSVTFPLQCSEYNQGCNGGYGFLESKWAEDVGLVPEHCAPFTDDPGACQALEDCDLGDRRYRAVNHRYVGGFYGGSDHEQIRQELVTNGPLVLSFEPKEDFMYYKSGLYRSGLNKIHQEWEQVDHAVLLVGLGSDGGQPYWVMQNSWGTQWGEDGFFRMARGIDESGCESIAVAADVVQDSGNDVLDNFLASL